MKVNYYGQNGEDCVLWSIFNNRKSGVFLEVGALDGRRFSNTLSFEEQGWTGVCVEAHPFYAECACKNRPRSKVIHAAVSYKDAESVTFYANKFGSLSTLDKSLETFFQRYKPCFQGFTEVTVPLKTINTILTQNNIDHVDVVSIDIEGTELDALRGFDLKKYKPEILVIEALNAVRVRNLRKYMHNQGYFFPRKISNNLFFCRNKKHIDIIKHAVVVPKSQLIHIPPIENKSNV